MTLWLLLVASWRSAVAGVPLPWIGLGLDDGCTGCFLLFFCGSQMMFQGLEGRMIGCDAQAKLLWELQLHFSKNSCAAVQDHADGSTRRKHLTTIGQCLVAGLAGNLDHDPVGVAAAVEDCLTSLCRVSPEVLQLTSMCILSFEY